MVIGLVNGSLVCAEDWLEEDFKNDIRGTARLLSTSTPASEFRELHFIVHLDDIVIQRNRPSFMHKITLFQELEKVLIAQLSSCLAVNTSFAIHYDMKREFTVHKDIVSIVRGVFPSLDLRKRLSITGMNRSMWYL